ncbi:AEC family transporter [Halobacillus litoralis]|uniref:AEC family transporter n=2 Tax=Halobacillus TaxID=45667 RepID=A0A845F7X9_9BACI|nr:MULTISPECIES: AEC family transporter [Halobacillus]MBN9655107.1 AEC family transporter [Halobacillus sp. GSS1]MBX0357783.1 AEC family transporter [Halobacillus sp. Nhm2S1]MYL69777.1 AEC family transporter [Halobacillus litoralis]REJ08909.1 AEC family transporter [Halobacillus trueperi]
MSVFIQVVLPVILIFGAGFTIQKIAKLDVKSVSTIALYVMLPCLVFQTFYEADLNGEYLMMLVFSGLLLFSILGINKIVSKVKNYDQSMESGLILSTAFMNSGNYGVPIILFAFGEEGFVYSVSFMVLQAIIMNFFGVYYAAKGTSGLKMALLSVLKMPPTYAVLVALPMNLGGVPVPENLMNSIDLLAAATVPMVMVVLGMQLAGIPLRNLEWPKVSYATTLRLIGSPLIAFVLTLVLPMSDMMAAVLIVSAAMPSAATTTIYAVQFNSKPDLVSSITLVTTLFSIVTIPILLNLFI